MKVTKVYRDYYLTEWTNPERRSAVGIICTIGPSVFSDYEQRTKATISELVEGGMDIARINLSHYPLLNGEANPELVKELVHIVKEIRAASASHRRPVNIMFDTQGPEFRVSALRVRKWDQLVAAVELKIEPRTRFTIADCDLKDLPFTTGCAALILENQELPAPQPGATCTLHIGSTTAALRAEKTAFGLQYVVTSPVKAKVRLPNGALPRLEWSGRGPLPLDIKGIRTAVLNLANMQENAVLYLASEKEADKLPTGLDEAVVFVEYEGNLCDDAGCRDTGYPIYASNGKVGFTYEGLLESRNEEAVAVKMRKSYGESLKVRMSMNLFENARYSARDCVFSASDRAYLGKLLCEDHGFTECPVDSIALSFTRHAGDLKQAYAELRAMGPKHPVGSIKLVAKIESPHCFWQYDEDRKTFNLDAERTYEGYKQILCEVRTNDGQMPAVGEDRDLCWAVMVARGDLGTEIKPAMVPKVQQELTDLANVHGKPVIVATQLMTSMEKQLVPSRADVTDVHNAVMGGADVVMLSEETALGDYPRDALRQARDAVDQAVKEQRGTNGNGKAKREGEAWRRAYLAKFDEAPPPKELMDHLGKPMFDLSVSTDSPVLFCYALTGATVRRLTRYRPPKPLIAITSTERVARDLIFFYGLHPLVIRRGIENHQNGDPSFSFSDLADVRKDNIVFGLLGIPRGEEVTYDRAIVVIEYKPACLDEPVGDCPVQTKHVYPRDLEDYRRFICSIIKLAKENSTRP